MSTATGFRSLAYASDRVAAPRSGSAPPPAKGSWKAGSCSGSNSRWPRGWSALSAHVRRQLGADLLAGLLKERFVRRVLPQDELLDDARRVAGALGRRRSPRASARVPARRPPRRLQPPPQPGGHASPAHAIRSRREFAFRLLWRRWITEQLVGVLGWVVDHLARRSPPEPRPVAGAPTIGGACSGGRAGSTSRAPRRR